MKLVLTSALAMILVSTIPAEAQLCAGAPSFRDNPLQVGASAAFRGGAQGVGGSFAAGGESLFAAAGVSVLNFDDVDSSATSVSGTIGVDLQADDNGRVFLCPIGQVAFTAGPDFGPVDVSTITLSGGVSVGVIASQSDALTVIPTFGLFAVTFSRDCGSRRFGQHRNQTHQGWRASAPGCSSIGTSQSSRRCWSRFRQATVTHCSRSGFCTASGGRSLDTSPGWRNWQTHRT